MNIISKYSKVDLNIFFRHFCCKVIVAVMLCVCPSFAAYAKGWVFVNVSDSLTGERLPFANVNSKVNPKKNFVADEEGTFKLNVVRNGEWEVTYVGYHGKMLPTIFHDTVIDVKLSPLSVDLSEVIVRPKKEKYSKKNNPAVDFIRKLRSRSKDFDPTKESFYSYDKYEKTVLGINDFQNDFSKGFLSKQGKFMKNYVDTSSWTGKRILDLIFKEKASTRLISNNPHADREEVKRFI